MGPMPLSRLITGEIFFFSLIESGSTEMEGGGFPAELLAGTLCSTLVHP